MGGAPVQDDPRMGRPRVRAGCVRRCRDCNLQAVLGAQRHEVLAFADPEPGPIVHNNRP